MNTLLKASTLIALGWASTQVYAQQPESPPKPTPQSEAGEPRADTSQPVPTAAKPGGAAKAGVVAKPGTAGKPAAAAAGATAAASPAGGQKAPGASDRLELGTATVTGDREQPKVMYIVPWKRSDIGDLAGKPMNSLVDEILAPVDRDVFKREVVYYKAVQADTYKAVQADTSQNGAPRHSSDQGEK